MHPNNTAPGKLQRLSMKLRPSLSMGSIKKGPCVSHYVRKENYDHIAVLNSLRNGETQNYNCHKF